MKLIELKQTIKNIIVESNNKILLKPTQTNQWYNEVKNWINSLHVAGRSPSGMKKEHEYLKWITKGIESIKEYYNDDITKANNLYDRIVRIITDDLGKNKIDLINQKFGINNKIVKIKGKYANYENNSTASEKRFKIIINQIEEHLSTFTGYHKKSIGGNKLNIELVKKEKSKATAVYKSELDIICIRPDRVKRFSDEYASFIYIITHELGHRFEKYNKLPENFDQPYWYTTKYSKAESWNGEEFAELFALTYWYDKYKADYGKVMDRFIKVMK